MSNFINITNIGTQIKKMSLMTLAQLNQIFFNALDEILQCLPKAIIKLILEYNYFTFLFYKTDNNHSRDIGIDVFIGQGINTWVNFLPIHKICQYNNPILSVEYLGGEYLKCDIRTDDMLTHEHLLINIFTGRLYEYSAHSIIGCLGKNVYSLEHNGDINCVKFENQDAYTNADKDGDTISSKPHQRQQVKIGYHNLNYLAAAVFENVVSQDYIGYLYKSIFDGTFLGLINNFSNVSSSNSSSSNSNVNNSKQHLCKYYDELSQYSPLVIVNEYIIFHQYEDDRFAIFNKETGKLLRQFWNLPRNGMIDSKCFYYGEQLLYYYHHESQLVYYCKPILQDPTFKPKWIKLLTKV